MAVEILLHTADVRIRVVAPSLEELFQEALRGMISIIKPDISGLADKKTRKVRILAANKTELLIDFLNEALSLSQINKEVYISVNFLMLSETALEADLHGAAIDSFDEDIKAATYHGAEITKNSERNYEVTILFDI